MSAHVTIGAEPLAYQEAFAKDRDGDGVADRVSYYDGERLVASAFDDDGDGRFDLWIAYDAELHVTREAVDRDHDGVADVVRMLTTDGHVAGEVMLAAPVRSDAGAAERPTLPIDPRLGGAAAILVIAAVAAIVLARGR